MMLDRISRRGLLQISAAALAAGGATQLPANPFGREGRRTASTPVACIMIFLKGGASQLETWDPKPGHPNSGETQAISTRIPGIAFAEYWPRLANLADQLTVLRTVVGSELDHRRAFFHLHTGKKIQESPTAPHIGELFASRDHRLRSDFPSFVSMGRTVSQGHLGASFAPLVTSLEELTSGRVESRERREERLQLSAIVKRRREDVDSSSADGNSRFARECRLALQLIEAGSSFVEIQHDGWDHHSSLWTKVPHPAAEVDHGLATLLTALRNSGRLSETLVLCLSEFGRSPQLNTRTPARGRDHWSRNFSVLMAGAGVERGACVGTTSSDGMTVTDRPVSVDAFHEELKWILGIRETPDRIQQVAPLTATPAPFGQKMAIPI